MAYHYVELITRCLIVCGAHTLIGADIYDCIRAIEHFMRQIGFQKLCNNSAIITSETNR